MKFFFNLPTVFQVYCHTLEECQLENVAESNSKIAIQTVVVREYIRWVANCIKKFIINSWLLDWIFSPYFVPEIAQNHPRFVIWEWTIVLRMKNAFLLATVVRMDAVNVQRGSPEIKKGCAYEANLKQPMQLKQRSRLQLARLLLHLLQLQRDTFDA